MKTLTDYQKTHTNKQIIALLSDKELWEYVLMPIETYMSVNISSFLEDCRKEFSIRKVKLKNPL